MKDTKVLLAGEPAVAPVQCQTDQPHRILVVEDDRDIRQISAAALVRSGYRVDAAEDGAAGWEALQAKNYDLLITDNNMPKVTGVEMIRLLREKDATLPVIMASGAIPAEELSREPRLQLAAMLLKPFTIAELIGTVKRVLRASDNAHHHVELYVPAMTEVFHSRYRKGWFALVLLIHALFLGRGLSQTLPAGDLKEFEGRYEYLSGASLLFAGSPRDGVLYAILDEAKYPLKRVSEGVFVQERTGSRVVFERGETGRVSGYRFHQEKTTNFFRRISDAEFSETMWFARRSPGNAPYQFTASVPPDLSDGLDVGSLQDAGLNVTLIGKMVEQIANETHKNVDSVLLIKKGQLVLEEYFYQYDRDKLHQLRSATKSVVSALVGIALDKKLIASKDEKVVALFPEYEIKNLSEEKRAITVEHLLACESGLACEDANPESPGEEQKMNVSPDWVRFILDLPMVESPGKTGKYCTGGVILLGRIVEKASGKRLSDFAAENLFGKLGITNYRWNFKPDSSSFDDACQLHMRPRDMAKLGLLYMNEGQWKGRQVISREWVKASLSKHSVVRGTDYGYLWWRQWLNVDGTRVDGVTAKGNGGQRIYLWPTLDLLVVITGASYNEQSPSDAIQIKYILPAAMR